MTTKRCKTCTLKNDKNYCKEKRHNVTDDHGCEAHKGEESFVLDKAKETVRELGKAMVKESKGKGKGKSKLKG